MVRFDRGHAPKPVPAITATATDEAPAVAAPATPPRKVVGGLPVVGAKSPEAAGLEARVAEQTFSGVAAVARGFCDELPIPWIEATVRRRMVGHEVKGERRLMGLLGTLLEECVQRGACEWYAPATIPLARPGGEGESADQGVDMHPSAVRRRAVRASFGGTGRAEQWARGIFDA